MSGIVMPVHTSTRYALVMNGRACDIHAVHSFYADSGKSYALTSLVTVMTGGTLAYGPPRLMHTTDIVMMAQNYKAANSLRSLREDDNDGPI